MNHRNSIQSLLARKCPPSSRHAAAVAGCNSNAPSHRAAAFLIGTTEAMIDSTGSVMRRAVFTAFGEPVYENGTTDTRYGYAGAWGYQEAGSADPLAELGWMHVGYRYYDPSSGRFVQRDPIGIEGGPNPYAYTGNNPVSAIDPDGLAIIVIQWGRGSNGHKWGHTVLFCTCTGQYISFVPGKGWHSPSSRTFSDDVADYGWPQYWWIFSVSEDKGEAAGNEGESYMGSLWSPIRNCITSVVDSLNTAGVGGKPLFDLPGFMRDWLDKRSGFHGRF